MCKYCEKENIKYIVNDDITYLYIQNNRGFHPQIIYGDYNGSDSFHRNIEIKYCPLCGERLK